MKRVYSLAQSVIISVLILVPFISHSYTSPGKPQGFVNDYAHIISPETYTAITTELVQLRDEKGFEVVVVTIPSLGDESIETYAVKLFEEWGIGNKEQDTGVLLLVAPTERRMRIEVGYGLEGALTDIETQDIQQSMLDDFRAEDYSTGILKGVSGIISAISSEAPSPVSKSGEGILNFLWQFAFLPIVILGSVLGRTKSWWLGGVIGAILGIIWGFWSSSLTTGLFSTLILTIIGLLFDYAVSSKRHHGGGGFWGGFGGGGGGGFGGFGGGSSGGGGSSSSW